MKTDNKEIKRHKKAHNVVWIIQRLLKLSTFFVAK